MCNTEELEILSKYFNGEFRYGPIFSSSLVPLILERCEEQQLKDKVVEITTVEGKVRNLAAHEIVSVTDEWFRKNTGKTAHEIMEILKYLIRKAGISVKSEDWSSYDRMNNKIIELMEREK